jgi:hypothetical protein
MQDGVAFMSNAVSAWHSNKFILIPWHGMRITCLDCQVEMVLGIDCPNKFYPRLRFAISPVLIELGQPYFRTTD